MTIGLCGWVGWEDSRIRKWPARSSACLARRCGAVLGVCTGGPAGRISTETVHLAPTLYQSAPPTRPGVPRWSQTRVLGDVHRDMRPQNHPRWALRAPQHVVSAHLDGFAAPPSAALQHACHAQSALMRPWLAQKHAQFVLRGTTWRVSWSRVTLGAPIRFITDAQKNARVVASVAPELVNCCKPTPHLLKNFNHEMLIASNTETLWYLWHSCYVEI